MIETSYYQGRGNQRSEDAQALPIIDSQALTKPSGYRASRELAAAVDVALTLGMPLLLTGEPGSGKSQLAHSIAWELGLGDVLTFSAKSDMQSSDLFYRFDTVGRFHAAQTKASDADPRRFITLNALGKAIIKALPQAQLEPVLGPVISGLHAPTGGCRSMVLIDEIDKAPRDVPNDILTEIEEMSFKIPEIAKQGEALPEFKLTDEQNQFRPIVIITSNSEKGLPDPFLRRCVYHHINFPAFDRDEQSDDTQVTITDIVVARLGERYQNGGKHLVHDIIKLFRYTREQELEYKPSLAELLNLLVQLIAVNDNEISQKRLKDMDKSYRDNVIKTTLLKNQQSQQNANDLLDQYFKT